MNQEATELLCLLLSSVCLSFAVMFFAKGMYVFTLSLMHSGYVALLFACLLHE